MGSSRIAGYGVVSTALALLSNQRLGKLMDEAPVVSSGIGGTATMLEIEGVPVFAKRIRLTDLERQPENVFSTANLFGLPTFCQYGIGSPGYGVWRELAANVMTTNWVLSGECESFPLMYHWRVLDGPMPSEPTAEELSEVDRTVAHWHDSTAMRERLEANARSTASVVLFLEYIPQDLFQWLADQLAAGDAAIEAAALLMEREMRSGTSFMNSRGLHHFDAHFGNILTDGERFYFADLGLATSSRFELSEAESDFLARNETHDGCYAMMQLVNWLVTKLSGVVAPGAEDPAARNAYIRRCAEGAEPENVSPVVAEIIKRYAPIVVVMNDFYGQLFGDNRKAPYPTEEIQTATRGSFSRVM